MRVPLCSWCLERFQQAKVRVPGKVRRWGDKEDHHSSLEHNPESIRTSYSPESRRRAVEDHKAM